MKFISSARARCSGLCLLSAILWSFSLLSCQDNPGLPDSPDQSDRLVVEAYLDTGGYPVVMLTTSLSPGQDPQDVADHLVRWGKVSVSDGSETVVLTGAMNADVFPPFTYTSYYMKGEPGRTYTVTAEYKGMTATARATLLPPPAIAGYSLERPQGMAGADTLRTLTVDFVIPPEVRASPSYYVAFARQARNAGLYLPCFLGTAEARPGQAQVSLAVCRPFSVLADKEAYSTAFTTGSTVSVMIAAVDKAVYDFWSEYQNQTLFGHSVFLSSSAASSALGNVSGGYGCFTARGAAVVDIDID